MSALSTDLGYVDLLHERLRRRGIDVPAHPTSKGATEPKIKHDGCEKELKPATQAKTETTKMTTALSGRITLYPSLSLLQSTRIVNDLRQTGATVTEPSLSQTSSSELDDEDPRFKYALDQMVHPALLVATLDPVGMGLYGHYEVTFIFCSEKDFLRPSSLQSGRLSPLEGMLQQIASLSRAVAIVIYKEGDKESDAQALAATTRAASESSNTTALQCKVKQLKNAMKQVYDQMQATHHDPYLQLILSPDMPTILTRLCETMTSLFSHSPEARPAISKK